MKPFFTYRIVFIISIVILSNACQIRYSLNQGNFDKMQTFSVQRFPNMAPIVQPTLSSLFTETLKDKIESLSPLNLVTDMGDGNFEGEIIEYLNKPINISGYETASQNRLSITIRVKYTNKVDPELDFDQKFTRFADYNSNQNFDSVEDGLIEEILELMLEDIYNAAFVNW